MAATKGLLHKSTAARRKSRLAKQVARASANVETMSDTTWLTPSAHAKLQEELEYLTTEGRRAIEKRIAEAREHGDLRENAEYDTAKNDQGLMEARIRQIKHTLENSEVRAADDSGKVEIGTVVTVIDEDGDEMDYFIASAENKVPGMILASPTSPVGISAARRRFPVRHGLTRRLAELSTSQSRAFASTRPSHHALARLRCFAMTL